MSDMRFLIQDYLALLRERGELDAILPDLLRAMGFQVVKLAFRGEVEHGVDLAAYSSEGNTGTLLLIQVKAGDIDQQLWDSGPNSIRATLNNLLDVPFEDLTQPRLQKAHKKVILAHNGTLRENVRDKFNGYIENSFTPILSFERWDIDQLSLFFEHYLLNERIMPIEHQKLLKRTIIFLDVPDYDLIDFKQLLGTLLTHQNKITKKKRDRLFGFLRLILAIIRKQCQEQNNLSTALEVYEYSVLQIWGWMVVNGLISKPMLDEYSNTYILYLQLLLEWADKLAPVFYIENGLFWGGPEEIVEYPLRTFKVIGNLGLLSISLAYLPDKELKYQLFPKAIDLLINAVTTNPSRHRPLLDNHSIDIFLGLWALLIARRKDIATSWVVDILEYLSIRKKVRKRLPELYNNIDAVIEYEASDERPLQYVDSSSTLIYFLFEFCLLLDIKDVYEKYCSIFDDVNFQVWYPPENVEGTLYFREVREGDTEIINHLPESYDEFFADVKARHTFDKDKQEYSPIKYGLPSLLLLANKHYRTPVFPFWWREAVFNSNTSPYISESSAG
jgi:hypothetical protein